MQRFSLTNCFRPPPPHFCLQNAIPVGLASQITSLPMVIGAMLSVNSPREKEASQKEIKANKNSKLNNNKKKYPGIFRTLPRLASSSHRNQ